MRENVVIFGTNELTRQFIPWNIPNAHYWAFNEVAGLREKPAEFWKAKGKPDGYEYWAKKIDVVFQLHAPAIWRNPANLNDPEHYQWLQRNQTIPVWMQERFEEVPASAKYPLEEVCESLLPHLRRENGEPVQYFTSSIAYALALAIYMGYQRIYLYGIEMTSDTEYVRQRDGVTFWIGQAIGRGIDVILPDKSLLMRAKLYGYTGEVMIQRQEFEVAARSQEKAAAQAQAKCLEQQGKAKALLEALAKTKSQADANRIYQEFMLALNAAQDAAFEYGALAGKLAENRRYLSECDALINAAGGEKALAAFVGEK